MVPRSVTANFQQKSIKYINFNRVSLGEEGRRKEGKLKEITASYLYTPYHYAYGTLNSYLVFFDT